MTIQIRSCSRLIGLSISTVLLPLILTAQSPTREITDRYLELTFSQQYDALLELYAPDVVFHDPTGDVFQGLVADGPVHGAGTIVAMQKSWGLAESVFDIRVAFTVGEYSLYRGTLKVRYPGEGTWTAIPFVTVLRAVDGHITERTDFGEYIESFGLGDRFRKATDDTRETARSYLSAYLNGDLDTQAFLFDPDVVFQDPTSKIYGPPFGEVYRGRDALIARRRQIYDSIRNFDLRMDDSFVANHHAVYMGTVTYTVGEEVHYVQPAVFVIEVQDGKVTRHWDFVDYSVAPVP